VYLPTTHQLKNISGVAADCRCCVWQWRGADAGCCLCWNESTGSSAATRNPVRSRRKMLTYGSIQRLL